MSGLSPNYQDLLERGIREFNTREFFECHETLEELWQKYLEPDRELIQGIIQIAVGYHHQLRNNSVGALKLLRRGLQRVEKFSPAHFNLDLVPFMEKVSQDILSIEKNADPPPVALHIPTIEFISPSPNC